MAGQLHRFDAIMTHPHRYKYFLKICGVIPHKSFGMILYLNFEIMEYYAQKSDKNVIGLGLVYIFKIKYIYIYIYKMECLIESK